jgi:hypothetical protein
VLALSLGSQGATIAAPRDTLVAAGGNVLLLLAGLAAAAGALSLLRTAPAAGRPA